MLAIHCMPDHAHIFVGFKPIVLISDFVKEVKVESNEFINKNGLAKALLARLLKLKGDMTGARKAFEAIDEKWLQLHPQIIIDRDKVLRNLGKQTLAEREAWLSKVDALKDEWIIERRVQLLIDKGEIQQAKELLLSTTFQKVHQT
ncbi:MAG: transposase [Bacteroidota bacterium]|nr:transposase [Bacteroidota bacterium]